MQRHGERLVGKLDGERDQSQRQVYHNCSGRMARSGRKIWQIKRQIAYQLRRNVTTICQENLTYLHTTPNLEEFGMTYNPQASHLYVPSTVAAVLWLWNSRK